ncbi:response regulator domain-containing protein [Clostridium sp. CAG:590]|nr:response regulator [Clostridium sp.]CCX85444.1 response regulator domain-containing protein [Clostridium sp. CAG:590]
MANILIVDDSRTSRKILKGILEGEGYEVVGEATNGQEGYDRYVELKPDVVTMDITMPVLDGIEALKKIKSEYPDAKVVMVTAAGQKTKMVEAVQNGASEFVSKPFEPEQLKKIIDKVIG